VVRILAVMGCSLLVGCGASWQLVEPLDGDCRRTLRYHQDLDGDGFGDPDVASVEACLPGEVEGFTARNGVDCDDQDPLATAGGVGTVCASDLFDHPRAWVVHLGADGQEALAVVSDARLSTVQGELVCGWWGGASGELAGLSAAAVREQLTDAEPPTGSVFVIGGRWEGARGEGLAGSYLPGEVEGDGRTPGAWTGTWVGVDALLAEAGWCGPAPVPGDVYPEHHPSDPVYTSFWDGVLPELRLGLRVDEGGGCVELLRAAPDPEQAPPGLICQRASPDPADFEGIAVGVEGGSAD
jgi:hypothetical protein